MESGVAYAINASGQIAGKGVYDAFATGGLGAAQHSGFAHARCPMLTREPPSIGNLFQESATPAKGERFDTLLAHGNLVVERIVSSANVTPVECVQPQDEWVVLLRGKATLAIQDRQVELMAGDHLFLPAGTPHTVLRVAEGTMWLAVHLHPPAPG